MSCAADETLYKSNISIRLYAHHKMPWVEDVHLGLWHILAERFSLATMHKRAKVMNSAAHVLVN